MRILVIGATGTIGSRVVEELAKRHEIVKAGFNNGDINVDINDLQSIRKMYKDVENIDAVVMTTGSVHFGLLSEMTVELYQKGLNSKLMGQVNVVLEGMKHLNDKGSFTLTSGILNRDPIIWGSSAAMVNGALDGFVKHAAIELPRGLRINIVSPTVIAEAKGYDAYFRGYKPVSAADAALLYSKSVEGSQTGQVYIAE